MIKVLIVDDEKPAREELEYLLKEIPDVSLVGIADDGPKALSLINKLLPDLVFLDIKMPEMNGFEVAAILQSFSYSPGIIFTTAYDKFAIKAFEINALDYILKPFIKDRIVISLNRFKSTNQSAPELDYNKITKLIDELKTELPSSRKISIPLGEHYKPILIEEIVAVAADGRGVRIFTVEGEFKYSKSITNMEESLYEEIFFRCHRAYIININLIDKIDIWFNNTYQLEMKGLSEKIPVSRTYVNQFRKLLSIG